MSSGSNRSRASSISSIGSFATTPDTLSMSSTPPPRGVGLSDPIQSAYRRRILEIIYRLRATGVEADIDLPVIAVIGSQSAGKSSLIEAISGITLPRAAGTCTRCPTECQLSYSDRPWSCQVVLRKTFDKYGKPLGPAAPIPFGSVITDKGEVEERIRRAQRAILNPSIGHETFLFGPDGEPAEGSELSFSKNRVCLELSGPDLTDLSFCDLPGLIVNVSQGGNESDIELVRDLVKSYVCKPSCLILLTVTCETDFENQGAHRMAKQYDPNGERTIGVLTKPDRIPSGEEDRWLRFIKGEAENLTNGWFTVKQPATSDLNDGMTWEEARQRESLFFSTILPWSSETDWHHRFGTHNLTKALSIILSDLIKRRLPEIEQELKRALEETEASLEELPGAPSDDAQGEIIMLISDFARELAAYVEGTPDRDGIHQSIRPLNRLFLETIRNTAPKFSPFEEGTGRLYTHPGFINSDIEREISSDDDDAICVDYVDTMGEEARARELPKHSLYIVTKRLIETSTEQWDTPSHNLLEAVYRILADKVNEVIDDHFLAFRYGRLHQNVKSIVNRVLAERQASALSKIDHLLVMETKAPYTVHEPDYEEYSEKYMNSYLSARAPPIMCEVDYVQRPCFSGNHHSYKHTGGPPAAAGQYSQALSYMANSRAYFRVAFKRFADMVPMMIDQELLRGLDWDRGLNSALTKGLGVTGPGSLEKAVGYLQEPPDVRSRRETLLRKLERLQAAKRELETI